MAVDPIALEQRFLEEKPVQTGFDLSKGLQSAQALGGTFVKGFELQEEKKKAAAFEQLLNTKQEGMNQYIQEQEEAGIDISSFPDPELYASSKENIANWYNLVNTESEKQTKQKGVTKGTEQLVAGEDKEALKTFADVGEISGKEAFTEFGKIRTRERVVKILEGEALGTRAIPSGETDPEIIQGSIDAILEQRDILSSSPESGELAIKAKIASFDKKMQDLQKRISRSKQDVRFFEKEKRLRDEAGAKATERFLKDTKDVRKIQTGLDAVSEALVDLGLPLGLETIDPTDVDIPGAGFLGEKFRRFVRTDAGVKFIANVERLISSDRHELYGAALTANESKNFKAMLGRNFLGNEKQFLAALRAMERVNNEALRGTKRQIKGLEDTITPEDKKPKKKKKTSTKVTLSKDATDEQISEILRSAGKQVTPATIEAVRKQLR